MRRVLSREKLAASVVGGRQKMTARHISPCEAKVGAAAPIFVSGESEGLGPPISSTTTLALSPNFVPKFVHHFTDQGQAHTALHIRLWRGAH